MQQETTETKGAPENDSTKTETTDSASQEEVKQADQSAAETNQEENQEITQPDTAVKKRGRPKKTKKEEENAEVSNEQTASENDKEFETIKWPHLEVIEEDSVDVKQLPKEIQTEINMWGVQSKRKNKSDKLMSTLKKKSIIIADAIQSYVEKDLPDEEPQQTGTEQNNQTQGGQNSADGNNNNQTQGGQNNTNGNKENQTQGGQNNAEGNKNDQKNETQDEQNSADGNNEGVERKKPRPDLFNRPFRRTPVTENENGEEYPRPLRPLRDIERNSPVEQRERHGTKGQEFKREQQKPFEKELTPEEKIKKAMGASRIISHIELCKILGKNSCAFREIVGNLICDNIYMSNNYTVKEIKKK